MHTRTAIITNRLTRSLPDATNSNNNIENMSALRIDTAKICDTPTPTQACVLMPSLIGWELVGGAGAANHPIDACLADQQKDTSATRECIVGRRQLRLGQAPTMIIHVLATAISGLTHLGLPIVERKHPRLFSIASHQGQVGHV